MRRRTSPRRAGRHRARLAAAALVAAAVAGGTASSPTQAAPPGRYVAGWIPYWDVTDGVRGLVAGGELFEEVSPFWFSATSATDIAVIGTDANLRKIADEARARGIAIIPTITDGTGRLQMQAILTDPASRAAHVATLVALVVDRGFDGIDIDYEGFAFSDGRESWPQTKGPWIAFVTELGAALRGIGKQLAVTVPPIWTQNGVQGYTVYAWPEIIAHVDRLRLMVYEWRSAGPTAPKWWVQNVADHTRTVLPAHELHKVQLGIPTYGRDAVTLIEGTCPANADLALRSVQMQNAPALIAARGATPYRDESSQEMILRSVHTYTGRRTAPLPAPVYDPPVVRAESVPREADPEGLREALRLAPPAADVTCTVHRTVYYPDETAVAERAQIALTAGFGGIVLWALGYESDQVWGPLAAVQR